jgi:hypothetical protein
MSFSLNDFRGDVIFRFHHVRVPVCDRACNISIDNLHLSLALFVLLLEKYFGELGPKLMARCRVNLPQG